MEIGAQPTILTKATSNPEQSGGLLDGIVDELKSTPKQDYSENHKKAEEQYQQQQAQIEEQTATNNEGGTTIESFEDVNRKSAESLVNIMNSSIAYTCAILAKEKSSDQFQPTTLQTNQLIDAWADGFNQMGQAVKIPWWIVLVVMLPVAYAPPITTALALRKEKAKAAKKPIKKEDQETTKNS